MNARWRRRLQYAAVCALIASYAGLSHYSNSSGDRELGAALAVGPISLVALILAWRSAPRPVALALTGGLAALLYVLWPLFKASYSLFYVVQESGIYVLLGLTFTRSLMSNRVAICTQLADRVHGPLSLREVLYTRRVTMAWAVFFFVVAAISVLLYGLAPFRVWSIYINFCMIPLVGAMFVTEYLVRRRALPETRRAGLLATIRVYFVPSEFS